MYILSPCLNYLMLSGNGNPSMGMASRKIMDLHSVAWTGCYYFMYKNTGLWPCRGFWGLGRAGHEVAAASSLATVPTHWHAAHHRGTENLGARPAPDVTFPSLQSPARIGHNNRQHSTDLNHNILLTAFLTWADHCYTTCSLCHAISQQYVWQVPWSQHMKKMLSQQFWNHTTELYIDAAYMKYCV